MYNDENYNSEKKKSVKETHVLVIGILICNLFGKTKWNFPHYKKKVYCTISK